MDLVITDEMIAYVRLRIADIPSSPFYPLFTDEEIKSFIRMANGNLRRATINAAMSAAFMLSAWNTREVVGAEQIWNDIGKNYLNVLDRLTNESSINNIDDGLVPYAAGISWEDMIKYRMNPDFVRQPLAQISACDGERLGDTGIKLVRTQRNVKIQDDKILRDRGN